ncbi:hypothetical protein GCM10027051_34970 [Niabella terrae]
MDRVNGPRQSPGRIGCILNLKIYTMKKLFTIAAIAAVTVACNNAADNTAATEDSAMIETLDETAMEASPAAAEGDISRQNGQVVVYQSGQWVPVAEDITLDNGLVVKANGDIVDPQGNTVQIDEGGRVTRAGQFFDKAGNAVENAWDATKTGVSNAAEATGDAVEKGVDATKEGVEKGVDATKSAAKKVGGAVKSGAEKVGDKARDIKSDIKGE